MELNFLKIEFHIELDFTVIEFYELMAMVALTDMAFLNKKCHLELDIQKIEFYEL